MFISRHGITSKKTESSTAPLWEHKTSHGSKVLLLSGHFVTIASSNSDVTRLPLRTASGRHVILNGFRSLPRTLKINSKQQLSTLHPVRPAIFPSSSNPPFIKITLKFDATTKHTASFNK